MRNQGYCLSKLKNGLKNLRKSEEAVYLYNSSSLASPLLKSLDSVFSSPETRARRREFAQFLQLSVTDDPLSYYKKVHGQILALGFESDTYLGNILMNVYSKADDIGSVRKLFGRMPDRNLVTWSTMISACTQHEFYEEALVAFSAFSRMRKYNPNEYILSSVIRACSRLDGSERSLGFQMHGFVVKRGFDRDLYVGTSLIDFYLMEDDIDSAMLVFDALPEKSTVTWTTLISGCAKRGRSEVSLQLFYQVRESNIVPDGFILSTGLSACSMLKFVEGGKQIHAYVIRHRHEMDVSLMNVIIDLYVKCAKVTAARKLFDGMVTKNIISWTTMLSGYMQNSLHEKAKELFSQMSLFGLKPDMFACSSILTSCASIRDLQYGRKVHVYTIKSNLETDSYVRNSLIDMYAKCDSLIDARKVFNLATDRHVVFFNAMIEGYSRHGELSEVLNIFRDMRFRSVQPMPLTFVSLLGASASLSNLELNEQLHGLMFKYGVCFDIFVGSALIDAYSKCSCIKDSRLVFEEMKEKDIVVWNAMFTGYFQQSENEEAFKLYAELQLSGEKPDEFTFAALFTAASNLASLRLGQELHCQLIKTGLESNLTNAVVDMYSKCGSPEEAYKAFTSAASRDAVCWNSVISSYANHGEGRKALQVLERMMNEGIEPNYITFVEILSACSHAGLVEDGLKHFESMLRLGIDPGTEHYACIVSLLGRAGRLNEAKEFIEAMPTRPAATIWRSLLSVCVTVGNIELAEHAAEMAISSDPTDSGSFIQLSNMYASKGKWADVKKIRERMKSEGVVKEPGRSWIEINNETHAFLSRDKSHSKADQIYRVLDDLFVQIKGASYLLEAALIPLDG
ncbi:PREDICTED: pentatricopeptide repeat-containing protein At4g39530 [Tarenaya hassleriana]|uniref:pentatricopeptide repeat-containing protein At4g39530 n=1 Tax=Tarenaya hassleriana TaxID=28532 RepID=UPI00053C6898|nr:PREDICTED: pentatricopeptide repeat-containing protein At4g39530 [Tarenaya hassleriana]